MKCDLFFHCHDAKEISSYYFHDTKPCAKHTKTCEFHIFCWDHFYKLNEWYLVDCFHPEYRVSSQIMVCSYCIAKCKNFSISPLQESPALPNKLEGFGPPQVIFFKVLSNADLLAFSCFVNDLWAKLDKKKWVRLFFQKWPQGGHCAAKQYIVQKNMSKESFLSFSFFNLKSETIKYIKCFYLCKIVS